MSRISAIIRRDQNTRLIESIVDYLEKIDLPGDVKKQIAMAVVKALHKQTGGKWDKAIEQAVSGAIEWVLAEIRQAAHTWDDDDDKPQPAEPVDPVEESIYGQPQEGEVPDQDELLVMGYKSGDVIWVRGDVNVYFAWAVTEAGKMLSAAGWTRYGTVGE